MTKRNAIKVVRNAFSGKNTYRRSTAQRALNKIAPNPVWPKMAYSLFLRMGYAK